MAYWVSRGEPSEGERSLTSFIRGTSIEAAGADEFFADLLEKVEALDTFGGDDPLSAPVAIATTKRYLDDPERGDVRLRELVNSIGQETRERLFGTGRFPMSWRPAATDGATVTAEFAAEVKRRILSYEKSCDAAAGLMTAGGYYAKEQKVPAFRELLELAASPPRVEESHLDIWDGLEVYPALLLLYACGVAATATENWPFLKVLMSDSMFTDIYGTSPLVLKVYPWTVDRQGITNAALHDDGQNYYEPVAEWLYRTLRGPLKGYLPLDFRYDTAFHKFETLLALTYVDIHKEQNADGRDWVPLSRFAVVHKMEHGRGSVLNTMRREYHEQGTQWGPIKGGLLKEPVSSSSTTLSVDTVGHNFKVIDAMIRRMSYF